MGDEHVKKRPETRIVSFLALALLLGCSDKTDVATSTPGRAIVGSAGGAVDADGIALTVPSGALSSSQTLTVTKTNDLPPNGMVAFSAIYRFEPDGLTFAAPVRVEFTVAAEQAPEARVFWTTGETFAPLETTTSGTTVAANVTHFSAGFAGRLRSGDGDAGVVDAGSNQCACASGLACCADACRSLENDPAHCGRCGNACPSASACLNGTCVVASGDGSY